MSGYDSESASWYVWLTELSILPPEFHDTLSMISSFFVRFPVLSPLACCFSLTEAPAGHSCPHTDHPHRRAADLRRAALGLEAYDFELAC
jgi:hypothetical protein